MPGFNGSGTYVRRYNWSQDQSSNLPISATKFDNDGNDVASGFNLCLTRDGQGVPTAPLAWAYSLTLNQASDATNLVLGRTGGTNNPVLTCGVTDAGGKVTFNVTGATAQWLLQTQGVTAITVDNSQNVTVAKNATITGTTTLTGAATTTGTLGVGTNLTVTGTSTFTGNVIGGMTVACNAQTPAITVTFSATSMTLNCALSNVFATTFTANVTSAPTISNPQDGQTINWFITQDGPGNRTMTWPTSFLWVAGVAGVLTTTGAGVDLLVATYRAASGKWYCSLLKAFA
jgi:hypothetical protein